MQENLDSQNSVILLTEIENRQPVQDNKEKKKERERKKEIKSRTKGMYSNICLGHVVSEHVNKMLRNAYS